MPTMPHFGTAATLQIGYILTSILITLLYCVAPLRDRFLSYGVRDHVSKQQPRNDQRKQQTRESLVYQRQTRFDAIMYELLRPFEPLLDRLQQLRVPHSWFKHLYLAAVPLAIFWLWQTSTRGAAYRWLVSELASSEMTVDKARAQVVRMQLVWTLFFAHLLRRLYESFAFDKQSQSTMWIGHYVMGLLHYLAVTVAIWIEAAPALNQQTKPSISWSDVQSLSLPLLFIVPIFVLLNVSQHRIHRYLYELPSKPRISIPSKGVFSTAISPHYGSEVGIYGCLTLLASSELSGPNWTMISVAVFVVSNLSISAMNSRDRFAFSHGPAAIERKSLLGLPGLCDANLNRLI